MSDQIIDTGPAGGLIFSYIWVNEDLLSKHVAPRKYGRVEIDYGGDKLATGILLNATQAVNQDGEEVEGAWELNISVSYVWSQQIAAKIQKDGELNVRVLS
jgi:hypothetical protein